MGARLHPYDPYNHTNTTMFSMYPCSGKCLSPMFDCNTNNKVPAGEGAKEWQFNWRKS